MRIIITTIWIVMFLIPEDLNLQIEALNTSRLITNGETNVFICDSKNSKKYHYKKNCRGLNKCKSSIKELSLTTAKKRGRNLCG